MRDADPLHGERHERERLLAHDEEPQHHGDREQAGDFADRLLQPVLAAGGLHHLDGEVVEEHPPHRPGQLHRRLRDHQEQRGGGHARKSRASPVGSGVFMLVSDFPIASCSSKKRAAY